MSLLNRLGFASNHGEAAFTPKLSNLNSNSDSDLDSNSDVEENTREAAFEAQQVVDLAKTSLDFLAAVSIPLTYQYA